MPGKILIIDDEEKLRRLLRRNLELEGYTLFEAATGKSGLQVLEKQEDIGVISDVKLPDIFELEIKSSGIVINVVKQNQDYLKTGVK